MQSYDERRRNYYGHQGANLASRDEMLEKRGVKKSTPNLPRMDATHRGAEKRLREGENLRNNMNSGAGSLTDKEARAAGFKSAAEMQAFYANRARMKKGNASGKKVGRANTPEQRQSGEDRSLLGRIFKPVNDALSGN